VIESTGEVVKFLSKDWAKLIRTNEDLRAHCKRLIELNSISSYKPQESIDLDTLEIDDTEMLD
jgi:hypothetical protein